MADVETQTTENPDVSAVTEALSQQINQLMGDMRGVRGQSREKQVKLDALEKTMDNSEIAIADLEALVETLGREVTTADEELAGLDGLYKNLLEQQAKLDEAGHTLYQQVSVQDQHLMKIKDAGKQQYTDITRARFLRDEMRDELYQKEDDLNIAQDRLQQQNMEYFKQFEGLKADVRRQRQESAPLLEELDSCERATLTRLNHFMKSEKITANDLEKSEKLKKFLEFISRYRKVFEEVGDLEFEVRNSERALEFSQAQVKAKMTRMESLERELFEMEGVFREGMGCFLKSTARRMDLTSALDSPSEPDTDQLSDEEEAVEREEFGHVGGLGLHRCVKVTDIRLQLDQEGRMEEEEAEVEVEVEDEEEVREDQAEVHEEETGFAGEEEEKEEEKEKEKAKAREAAAAQKSEGTSPRATPRLVLEGAVSTDATTKHLSSIVHQGDRLLSKDSRSSFVKPTHRTGLRATGSSAAYSASTSGRKQKK